MGGAGAKSAEEIPEITPLTLVTGMPGFKQIVCPARGPGLGVAEIFVAGKSGAV